MANLPVDHDMPVVGGTGQFLGATGFTELHNQREATLTVWVPRLPRF